MPYVGQSGPRARNSPTRNSTHVVVHGPLVRVAGFGCGLVWCWVPRAVSRGVCGVPCAGGRPLSCLVSGPPCPVLACSALVWLAWLGPLSCPLPGAGVSLLWGTSQGPALGGASPAKGAREPAGPKQARAAAPSHHKGGGGPKQPGPSEGGPKPSRGGHQARNRGGLGLYVPLTLTLATYEPRLAPRLGLGMCM